MRTEKLHGLVLKRKNFGEADRLVTIFTLEKGKITLLGKGIRRIKSHRAPHLELFNEVELLTHQGRSFDLITEAKLISSFVTLKSDLELSGYGFYLTEVLDRILPEKVAHEKIFFELLSTLQQLNRLKNNRQFAESAVKEFIVKLLWDPGYLPRGQYPEIGLTDFIESIVERKIQSKEFLESL